MKIEGIILYSQPFFEKDKRVELFDIAGGRVTLLAKSACVSIKRFGGRLEPTTYIQGAVTRKPGLSQLTDCTVIEAFPNLRTDFNRISIAMYCLELVKKITVDGQPHPELFGLLLKSLRMLDQDSSNIKTIKSEFESELLAIEGIGNPHDSRSFSMIFEDYSGKRIAPPTILS